MNLFAQFPWLRRWETLLFGVLCLAVVANARLSEYYFGINNLANIFHLSIEKAFVVLIMALVIINGEIDLSVASVMGLAAAVLAYKFEGGASLETSILFALLAGLACGAVNGFFVAYLGIPSLVVTLAGLVAYRGVARVLLENRSVSGFPDWFTSFARDDFIGAFEATTYIFLLLFVVILVLLQFTSFGRYIYIIGNNREAAEYAGVPVKRVKMALFIMSGLIAAFAGLMYAARVGSIRANAAEGFELDIITIVLLGGVSIFGGTGTMLGVGLSLLVVLNLRNGMSLRNVNGSTQASVVGALLILSVLIPNGVQAVQRFFAQGTTGKQSSTLALESQEVQESTEAV